MSDVLPRLCEAGCRCHTCRNVWVRKHPDGPRFDLARPGLVDAHLCEDCGSVLTGLVGLADHYANVCRTACQACGEPVGEYGCACG